MNISVTRFVALGALVLLFAAPVRADDEDLELRGEATVGANLSIIDGPWDDSDVGSYWDQYRYTRDKSDDPPFFVDVMHLDVGLARSDDTYLLRLERWSPNELNDRAELEVDWKGLGFDLDYSRYRSDELRFFPRGTYQDEAIPPGGSAVYGTQYTPDTPWNGVFDQNRRFYTRRTGVGGELRFRPEGFGFSLPVLRQASFRSAYEERKGYRQDSFLLDGTLETLLLNDNQRFRGNRRKIDQEVSTVGGGLVLQPFEALTVDLDASFQAFRENAPVVTLDDVYAQAGVPAGSPLPFAGARAFNFIPDTDRITANAKYQLRAGPARLHGGAFVTHVEQTNRAPLQKALRSAGQQQQQPEVTTWSLHTALDAPLSERSSLAGYLKFVERRNEMDGNDFPGRVPPGVTPTAQVDPLLRRRRELEGELELATRPQAGTTIAAGYRFDYVDWKLRHSQQGGGIERAVGSMSSDSNDHTAYVRAQTRLLRSLQLRGELGLRYAPDVETPSDPRRVLYFETRGSYSFASPIPLTFSVFGNVSDAEGAGKVFGGVRKDVSRLRWHYGLTATTVPIRNATLFATFVQSQDEQKFAHLRSDNARHAGAANVNFFRDSRPTYRSRVESLMAGWRQRFPGGWDASVNTSTTWVRADFADSNTTADALEEANRIRSVILSAGGGFGWQVMPGLRFGTAYRFDHYNDKEDLEPIDQDAEVHTFTLTATLGSELLSGL